MPVPCAVHDADYGPAMSEQPWRIDHMSGGALAWFYLRPYEVPWSVRKAQPPGNLGVLWIQAGCVRGNLDEGPSNWPRPRGAPVAHRYNHREAVEVAKNNELVC